MLDQNTHSLNSYGLPFSYQVNRRADVVVEIIDEDNSASYFGKTNCNNEQVNGSDAPCFTKDTPPSSVHPISDNNFTIEDDTGQKLAIHIPAVVISHGHNNCDSNNLGTYELDNCSLTATTFYRAQQNRTGTDKFDDVLIWVSSLEIKNVTPGILNPIPSGGNGTGDDSGNNGTGGSLTHSPSTKLKDTNLFDNPEIYKEIKEGKTVTIEDQTIKVDKEIEGTLILNGNNIVKTDDLDDDGIIKLTGGNNIIEIEELEGKILETAGANGHNSIRIDDKLDDDGLISLNDGNNKIYIRKDMEGTIKLGSGTNVVYINDKFKSGAKILGNGGVLYVNLNPIPGTAKISGFSQVLYCNNPNMNCP